MLRAPSTYSLTLSNTAAAYGDGDSDEEGCDAGLPAPPPAVNENDAPRNGSLASVGTAATAATVDSVALNRALPVSSKLAKRASFTIKKPEQKVVDWMAEEDNVRVEVSVSDPRLVPQSHKQRRTSTSMLRSLIHRKETHYAVTTVVTLPGAAAPATNITVERSFKDFGLLRVLLSRRFPGACVPPLPQTKTMGATADPFIRKRMRMLELFAQTLADHAFFRNDDAYVAFFLNQVDFDSSATRLPDMSEGTERWRQAIAVAPRPRRFAELCDAVTAELRASHKALVAVKAAAKTEVQRGAARVGACRDLADALDRWQNTERAAESPLSGAVHIDVFEPDKPARSMDATLPDTLLYVSTHTADLAAAVQAKYGEDQMEETLLDATRFEMATINTWLEAVELARIADKRARAAQLDVNAFQASVNAAVPGTAGALVANAKLEDAKRALNDANDDLAMYEKGLMCVELLRLRQARVLRALRLKDALANMHRNGAEAILGVWGVSTPPPASAPAPEAPAPAPAPAPEPAPAPAPPAAPAAEPTPPPGPPPTPAPTEAEILKAANEALAATKKAVESIPKIQNPVVVVPPPPTPVGIPFAEANDLITKRFWALTYALFFMQMLLAVVFLFRGHARDALPVLSVGFVTMGTAHVVHVAYGPVEGP